MKLTRVNPFGIFKVSEKVMETIQSHPTQDVTNASIKELVTSLKKNGSAAFIGFSPDNNEMFTFIPLIEGDQLFASHFPDPIQLYFSLAYSNFVSSQQARQQIVFQKDQPALFNFVNPYLYNWHLQYKISTIIFLHSTVEAFINYLMPEEFIYTQVYKANRSDKFTKQVKEYNKEQTEKYIQFKEKLASVLPQLSDIDLQKSDQKIYDLLLNLNALRNDLIHLRSTKEKNQEYFQKVFDKIVNIDLAPFISSVKDFINLLKPGFIEFEEVFKKEEPVFTLKFETFGAFALDISIFLKILEVPQKKVVLAIPKNDDPTFQQTMNWVMQNLNIMAQKQLIYFPEVDESNETKLTIHITKTGKNIGESTHD